MNDVLRLDEKYVLSMCMRYMGRGLGLDELYSLAQEGIRRAYQNYDPDHPSKAKFQTYATIWIKEQFLQRFKELEKEWNKKGQS